MNNLKNFIIDYEKIISNIEKGEAKLQKIQEIQDVLTQKITSHRNPLQQLKSPYHQNKGRNYTEDEDRYLVNFNNYLTLKQLKNLMILIYIYYYYYFYYYY